MYAKDNYDNKTNYELFKSFLICKCSLIHNFVMFTSGRMECHQFQKPEKFELWKLMASYIGNAVNFKILCTFIKFLL